MDIQAPVKSSYSTLPYYDIDWKLLEKLCYRIICDLFGDENCSHYGEYGQNQRGFDLFARDGENYRLFQCKNAKVFKKEDLKKAIARWEKDEWYDSTSEFYIFTSNTLIDTSFIDEFELQKKWLKGKGKALYAWGAIKIDSILKTKPAIVNEFFGLDWMQHFCDSFAIMNYGDGKLVRLSQRSVSYQPVQYYIGRTLQIEVVDFENPSMHIKYENQSLIEYIRSKFKEEQPVRSIVLAEAAMGKSLELENIAYKFSYPSSGLFPLLIRLKNFSGEIEEYISKVYEGWLNIVPERIILLFDGLDEIPSGEFNLFIKKFNTFLQVQGRVNIIASIRSNVMTNQIGNGVDNEKKLKRLHLNELQSQDVASYVDKKNLSSQHRSVFERFCKIKWVKDILFNPFYLSAIVDLLEINVLPKSKSELVTNLITLKINQDLAKYGKEIHLPKLLMFAKRLSLFLTLTGKNAIDSSRLSELTDLPLENIIKCSLFKIEDEGISILVSFIHNNFQEFLAAECLARLNWTRLKPLLFHIGKDIIVKPKMVNATSFIFSILPPNSETFKSLVSTIRETEPSLLINLEKDKLARPLRFDIFKDIVLKGKEQRIYYLYDPLRAVDIVEFLNHSKDAYQFILNELSAAEEQNHVYCLLDLIENFSKGSIEDSLKQKTLGVLKKILGTIGWDYPVYDKAIDLLVKFKFFSSDILQKTIKKCPMINHKMVRGRWIYFRVQICYQKL